MTDIKTSADNLLKEFKTKIANMKKRGNEPSYSVDVAIWNNKCGGLTSYSIRLNNHEIVSNLENQYSVVSVLKEFRKGLETLKTKRGWGGIVFDLDEWGGSGFRSGWEIITKVTLVEKPCKEFGSLQNFIKKYAGFELKPYDLFHSYMGGKRGRLYGEEGERYYLCTNKSKCSLILDELRKHRTTKDVITCKKGREEYIDPTDRAYSIRHEVECDGELRHYLEITIKTPNGKVKYSTTIY